MNVAPASYIAVILLSLEAFVLLLIPLAITAGCGMACAGSGASCRRCLPRRATTWRWRTWLWNVAAPLSSRRSSPRMRLPRK